MSSDGLIVETGSEMRTGVVAVGGAYSSVVEWFGGAGRPEGTVPCGGRCGAWWSLRSAEGGRRRRRDRSSDA